MSRELWAALDEIDDDTIVKGGELENWRLECRWQAENHPDREIRGMFKRAATMDNLTRKNARTLAGLAYVERGYDD
jgi:hypothetical protein